MIIDNGVLGFSLYKLVADAPEVEVTLQLSDESLVEGTFHNATVRCNLVDGNPFVMETVLWFLDGSLIMEQECYDRYLGYIRYLAL